MNEFTSWQRQTGRSPSGFEILYDAATAIGYLTLRRRRSVALECDVFEMLVDDRLMMSSAVTASEIALVERGLERLPQKPLRVLIGGLGLGFTVIAALEHPGVNDVTVVERLEPVIGWHQHGTFPWSAQLMSDARVRIVEDDFFEFVRRDVESDLRYDAVLIDIDDAPDITWHPSHALFYSSAGLRALQGCLQPAGAVAIWCAVEPSSAFLQQAREVFSAVEVIEVSFENPCLHEQQNHFIVLATQPMIGKS